MASYTKAIILRMLAGTILVTGLAGISLWGATERTDRTQLDISLSRYEVMLDRLAMHTSEFAPLAAPLATPTCADNRPPEALATPDPLLGKDSPVRVSFIVNADGRVESPFILESAGEAEDQIVLRAVRHWRFRPALCNGVPTEMEARVRFVGQTASQ